VTEDSLLIGNSNYDFATVFRTGKGKYETEIEIIEGLLLEGSHTLELSTKEPVNI